MIILFICGHHYAGKTTLAKSLEAKGFTKLSLSDALRSTCLQRLKDEGYTYSHSIFLEGKDKPWGYFDTPTPRDYLKKVGMEMREKDPTWLAKALERMIGSLSATKIVIDDWRFPHEIQWFLDRGYPVKSLRITRPSTHPSEEEIKTRGITEAFIDTFEVSYVLMSDGQSPECLADEVVKLLHI